MEQGIITSEIEKLLELKVISVTVRQAEQVISPVFLRRKKNGEYRMVLNLEKLNLHIPYQHFKMEDFELAVRLINAGDFLASVDLRHAYYSIKIAEEQQKFFCFSWQGTIYQFNCLPNGVSEGPRIFTKLMKPVYSALRNKGYTITSYIDDSLICSSSRAGCQSCVQDTVTLLGKLGFCINKDKSVLVPTQCIEYLGNVIDTVTMTISLPVRRVLTLVQACEALMRQVVAQIRQVARVIGLLVAATSAVPLGKLHYRVLEKAKIAALQQAHGDFDASMLISADMKSELLWWCANAATQKRDIFRAAADIEVFTDASTVGWGGSLHMVPTGGSWSLEELSLHINALELKAILFTLQAFTQELRNKHVKVFCDNTTAVTYVNEMGGTKSITCNDIAILIWDWCVANNAWVTCSHIPGKDNQVADAASRKVNAWHEWKLNVPTFQLLCNVFGFPSIDLFASRLNRQITPFCSWKPDPEAAFFDAFSLNWSSFPLTYLFPPFSLISRCLQKIRAEKAKGWIVVPFWTSQPWMGMLLGMLIDHPRLIRKSKFILTHPSSAETHPLMGHTQLMACLLSGNPLEHGAFIQRVRGSSWRPGNQVQSCSTGHTSGGGHTFVVQGISIPLIPLCQTSSTS